MREFLTTINHPAYEAVWDAEVALHLCATIARPTASGSEDRPHKHGKDVVHIEKRLASLSVYADEGKIDQ